MHAGLDFGTSSCSIGVWEHHKPVLLPLEGTSTRLPSAIYTYRTHIEVGELDPSEFAKRVAEEKRKLTDEAKSAKEEKRPFLMQSQEELERQIGTVMRRELAGHARAKYRDQTIGAALSSDTGVFFGEQAISLHISDPDDGYFVKSPKSFLGADLKTHQRNMFQSVVSKMLSHIKISAEHSVGSSIERIVLGRPVKFHGTNGEAGNRQALDILTQGAKEAGFGDAEFLMEPIAAALEFERHVSHDLTVLVLDIGGGTTDCSMVRIGPSYIDRDDRADTILGATGTRIGGIDMDIKLAWRKILPLLGKGSLLTNGLPIPGSVYWNAVAVNDINAQMDFLSVKTKREIVDLILRAQSKELVSRLQTLQTSRLSYRLNRSAELAKIHLTDRELINLPLRYIEPELVMQLTRKDLSQSVEEELNEFVSIAREVEKQAGVSPDLLYVTGGSAKSPIVEAWIRSEYPALEIVVGDVFGSVASGLTAWAEKVYK